MNNDIYDKRYSDICYFCSGRIDKEDRDTYYLRHGTIMQPACKDCYTRATGAQKMEDHSPNRGPGDPEFVTINKITPAIQALIKANKMLDRLATDKEVHARQREQLELLRQRVLDVQYQVYAMGSLSAKFEAVSDGGWYEKA